MPVSAATLSAQMQVSENRPNAGFPDTTCGPSSLSFALANLNLTTWNQAYQAQFTVSPVLATPTGVSAALAAAGALTIGQAYYYKVTATGAQGETLPSAEATATPTSGNQSITVSWTAVTNAVGYNVYRGTTPGGENFLVGSTTSAVTFTDNGTTGAAATLPASNTTGYLDFSLLNFTTFVEGPVSFGHALAGIFLPLTTSGTGAGCIVGPSPSNGFGVNVNQGWWLNTSSGNPVHIGGCLLTSAATSDAGQPVALSNQFIRITNPGTGPLVILVGILGSTT